MQTWRLAARDTTSRSTSSRWSTAAGAAERAARTLRSLDGVSQEHQVATTAAWRAASGARSTYGQRPSAGSGPALASQETTAASAPSSLTDVNAPKWAHTECRSSCTTATGPSWCVTPATTRHASTRHICCQATPRRTQETWWSADEVTPRSGRTVRTVIRTTRRTPTSASRAIVSAGSAPESMLVCSMRGNPRSGTRPVVARTVLKATRTTRRTPSLRPLGTGGAGLAPTPAPKRSRPGVGASTPKVSEQRLRPGNARTSNASAERTSSALAIGGI
jgi:hypothetical protein